MTLPNLAFPLVRILIRKLDADSGHSLAVQLLKYAPTSHAEYSTPNLSVSAFCVEFPNPLGAAAGSDKNAELSSKLHGLGFGYVEVGTVTPRPQLGNPRPRQFLLAEDRAEINRMGFNNEGHAAAKRRLISRRPNGIIGVNIGANKDSPDRVADYVAGIAAFSDIASYLTVNISSPNTPGLRSLQSRAELTNLLGRLNEARARQKRHPPMLLKISPDLSAGELADVARCCEGGAVDGIVVSNTTITRPNLKSRHSSEQGGLSGEPLFDLSTRQLSRLYLLTGGRIPLVGVGGISDAATAWTKLAAGATLLQLYTAFIYQGPAVIERILSGLAARLAAENITLAELRGRDAERIAHHGLSGT